MEPSSANYYSSGLGNCSAPMQSQPPQETGVSSAIQELMGAVSDTNTLACSLEGAVGLSVPEKSAESSSPKTMAQYIRAAIYLARSANERLSSVNRHLSS